MAGITAERQRCCSSLLLTVKEIYVGMFLRMRFLPGSGKE